MRVRVSIDAMWGHQKLVEPGVKLSKMLTFNFGPLLLENDLL